MAKEGTSDDLEAIVSADKSDIIKKKKIIIDSLRKNQGNVSLACKAANVSRDTFYRYRSEDAEFARAADDVKEELLDSAESELTKQIKSGNTTALIFFLKTQGRVRGYGDELAITGKGGKDFMPDTIKVEVLGKDKSKQ